MLIFQKESDNAAILKEGTDNGWRDNSCKQRSISHAAQDLRDETKNGRKNDYG